MSKNELNYKYISNILIMLFINILCCANILLAQGGLATLSGTVTDESGAVIPGAEVTIENRATGLKRTVTTNISGVYLFPALKPDTYTITAQKDGFAPIEFKDIVLNVGDEKGLKIQMKVGDVSAEVTVDAGVVLSNETAAVSTVVDRNIIENMPLNGRTMQPLIQLSPGVVPLQTSGEPNGFSVNGQRPSANYTIVDGVSANTGITIGNRNIADGNNGSRAGTNAQGSYASLVSVDAIQEFQILTSTFAPEFGRAPGGQVIINTRSGENKYHGTLHEDFRNDYLDARSFFDVEKPALRYNNFGGTFSGPLPFFNFGEGGPFFHSGKDRTHFFFSYEGQRFLLPQPRTSAPVPSVAARESATSEAARSIFDAYPLPTSSINADTGLFEAAFSDPNNADNASLRIDHNYKGKFMFFGRTNWSQSASETRVISDLNSSQYDSKFFTFGATQILSSNLVNDLRFNWTRSEANSVMKYDGFGGGAGFPSDVLGVFDGASANMTIRLTRGFTARISSGEGAQNTQRQMNIVDNVTYNAGSHQLKFGVDFRRLKPSIGQVGVSDQHIFLFTSGVNALRTFILRRTAQRQVTTIYDTFSVYGQDTWKINPKTTMTFGLRWEINPSPRADDENLPFVTFDRIPDLTQTDLSAVDIAVTNKFYDTSYSNFAPRFGIAYRASEKAGRELTIRGGIGLFYDIGQTGFGGDTYPYGINQRVINASLPLAPFEFPDPNFDLSPINRQALNGADETYATPRSYQWNVTAEQSLGSNQRVQVAYVGQMGRKLLRVRGFLTASNDSVPGRYFHPDVSFFTLVGSRGESDYHSLQAQYSRRFSRRFSTLVNYTLGRSQDTESENSGDQQPINEIAEEQKGPSSFDVRHVFSAAATYEIPTPKSWNGFVNTLFGGWALNAFATARSGTPFNVAISTNDIASSGLVNVRPNVTGEPFWIYDDSLAGGRRLNPDAFDFATIPANGLHGNLGRNQLRGLGAWQVNLSLHKNFRFTERINLRLGIDSFNVLNHANFANPTQTRGSVSGPFRDFGLFTRILSRAGVSATGASPLFASGGPRSHQLSMKFSF